MAVRCSGGDAVRQAVGPVRERLLEHVVGTGGYSGGDAVRRAVGPVREQLLERVVGTGGVPALLSQHEACGAKKGNPTGGIGPPHSKISSKLGEGGV